MKIFVLRLFTLVGILTVVVVLLAAATAIFAGLTQRKVKAVTVLEGDFTVPIVDHRPPGPLSAVVTPRAPSVREVTEAIYAGAGDSRVRAMIGRIGGGMLGPATVEEIRNAVLAFRRSGKPAVAFAESFGEGGGGTLDYYLATAFDTIYLQPSGSLNLVGFAATTPFVKRTLDKLQVKPQLDHRKRYKSALYTFTQTGYVEPHREADSAVLASLTLTVAEGIAARRGMAVDTVRTLIDRGPYNAEQARELGLVDRLAYRDEAYAEAGKLTGTVPDLLYLSAYRRRVRGRLSRGKTVALIYGVGTIYRGKSRSSPLSGVLMGAETVTAAFRAAIDDKKVRAILFRINSPGGSYVASDMIRRETERARQAGKPVIVSMGDVAGSGGYFIACAADKIVAHPATITGSIGVISGKMVTTGLWNGLGIDWGRLKAADNAAIWSSLEEFSPEQWELLQSWLDQIYDDFVTKVGEGRGMAREQVEEAAKGRIWSGVDAAKLGLVDTLGGMPEAIALAKSAAGLRPDQPVHLKLFPPRESFLSRLLSPQPASSEHPFPTADIMTDPALTELLPLAAALRTIVPPEPLTMRPVEYR